MRKIRKTIKSHLTLCMLLLFINVPFSTSTSYGATKNIETIDRELTGEKGHNGVQGKHFRAAAVRRNVPLCI